jgi:outer membrane protein OmpA-like peptidoglycan-associated protein
MMQRLIGSILLAASALACADSAFAIETAKSNVQAANVFNISNGAVLIEKSGEYNNSRWSAFNIFDGDRSLGWCSDDNHPFGDSMLLELPSTFQLKTITFDTRDVQDHNNPGVAARKVELWTSNASPHGQFTLAKTFELPNLQQTSFPLVGFPPARWLKFVMKSNWGNKNYTEIMDIAATGTPSGAAPSPASFTGVYSTNNGTMRLQQSGNAVVGCYYDGKAKISGTADGNVLRFQYTQSNDNQTGSALMVLSQEKLLNGVWYRTGAVVPGEWLGKRDDSQTCECPFLKEGTANGIANSLSDVGKAIIYGIHFATDKADINPDSQATLKQLLAAIQSAKNGKIEVSGYTDSTNTDAYNVSLSKRRAKAVVDWLLSNGLPASRITSEGYGEAQPVADNATEQGRALNRRVEVVVKR